jgi:hypothetical protein
VGGERGASRAWNGGPGSPKVSGPPLHALCSLVTVSRGLYAPFTFSELDVDPLNCERDADTNTTMHRSTTHLRTVASSSSSRVARSLNAAALLGARRRLHYVRDLPYPVEQGLGKFLPPDALRAVGTEYQKGLLDRINDYSKGELEPERVA